MKLKFRNKTIIENTHCIVLNSDSNYPFDLFSGIQDAHRLISIRLDKNDLKAFIKYLNLEVGI